MNHSEYLKFFDKYVEYNDKGMSKELRDLDRELEEYEGYSLEAEKIKNTAKMDYAKLKAKRYTESNPQLTKEELSDVLIEINHQMQAPLFKELFQQDRLSLDAIKNSLIEVYTGSEDFDQMFFLPIFQKVKEEDGVLLMTEEDRRLFESLPDKVVIYRGMREDEDIKNKLSFTVSFDMAVFFANRHSEQSEKGVVVSSVVNKSDILALIQGEDEVIIAPQNLGEITIVQDGEGPTNRPYVGVGAYLDGDSDLVVLYQASDEETYENCYENCNWKELEDGWTTDLKQAESDVLDRSSKDEEGLVILSVEINRKYLSEYRKSSKTFTIDFEKAFEDNEEFEEPEIYCGAEEVVFKKNLPEKVMVYTDVERETYEEVIGGERSWADALSGWWKSVRDDIEDSLDDEDDYVIFSTEISKDYIEGCHKTTRGFALCLDLEKAIKDGKFVEPHIVED